MKNTMKKITQTPDKIYMLPIILLIGYVPLIVRMVEYDPGLNVVPWGYDGSERDFFLIWKMRIMLALSVIMLIMLVCRMLHEKISVLSIPPELLLLFPYSVFVLLSGIMSPWRKYAFFGSFEMFRSVPLVLSYVLMCIYSCLIVKTKEHMIFIFKGASLGIFIMGLIGTLQTFGINIFNTYIIKLIMLPVSEWDYAEDMTVGDGVYATLFNPDYFAMYIGMILPVTIVSVIIIHDMKWRMYFALTSLLLMISLIGTGTASEYITLCLTCFVGALILSSRNKRSMSICLISLCTAVIIGVSLFFLIPTLHDKASTAFVGTEVYRETMRDPVIETLDDKIHFIYPDGQEINIRYDMKNGSDMNINVTDADGKDIPLIPYDTPENEEFDISTYDTSDCLMIDDEDLELTIITPVTDEDPAHILRLAMMGREYEFTYAKETGYCYITPGSRDIIKLSEPEKPRMFPDALMSGRGWIWNYSIPMLKKSMLLGCGSNTFIFEFPHNYAHYADGGEFDVKPHSMYLQQWIENSFPAFLLLVIFVMLCFIKSIKVLKFTNIRSDTAMLAFGLLLGIVSYMISGLVNDSMMFISPFFWVFTGLVIRSYQTADVFDSKLSL